MSGTFDPWGSYRLFPGMSLNTTIDFLSSLLEAKSEDQLLSSLDQAAQRCGFEKFLVGMQWHGPQGDLRYRVLSGYPMPWQQLYLERGYVGIDPTVAYCQSSDAPLVWSEDLFLETDSMPMLEEARRFGLGFGISLPIHEMHGVKSMVSLARDQAFDDAREEAELVSSGRLLANCAHFAYRKFLHGEMRGEVEQSLSGQERECLRWVALGKTSYEIGRILHISEGTVVFHIKNLMEKLDVKNRPQAVAVAFRLGLIH
jgi:DNA-binding CsgD family transcriptional regulator